MCAYTRGASICNFAFACLLESDCEELLYSLMITENNYTQLITDFTTDSRTLIDHLYTNLMDEVINVGVLETYFSDHKAIWASLN